MPSSSGIEGAQPSFCLISVLSLLRPRTPLGASRLKRRFSLTPAISSTMSTSWLMVTSSSLPRLMGSTHVARHERLGAVHAVIDVHEAPRLLAVAPDLDLTLPRHKRGDHFAADRGRRLFPSAVIGPVRPVDVVIARHARRQSIVLGKMAAHPLAEQLLPAISVLRHRRIRIGLLQRKDIGLVCLSAAYTHADDA